MRANSLLEKGIHTGDRGSFEGAAENLDKIITEYEAFQSLMAEYKTLHFFLVGIHSLIVIGIGAHIYLVTRDFKAESRFCLLVNPSSYAFLQCFSLLVIISSAISLKHTFRQKLSPAYFVKIKFLHFGLFACVGGMVVSLVFGNRLCKSNHKLTLWPLIWVIFTFVHAALLRSYTNWIEDELKELGIFGEKVDNKQTPTSPDLSCTVELPSDGFRTRHPSVFAGGMNPDMSLNSITTV